MELVTAGGGRSDVGSDTPISPNSNSSIIRSKSISNRIISVRTTTSRRLCLESLPSEILWLICGSFAPEPHVPGDPVSEDFVQTQRTLRHLCLTSRRLQHAATPFLYGVIILHSSCPIPRRSITPGPSATGGLKLPPLALLLRTLLESPRLRPGIRHIACLVNLTGSRVSSVELESIRSVWNSACQGVKLGASDARILRLADLPTTSSSINPHPSVGKNKHAPPTPPGDSSSDEDSLEDCVAAAGAPVATTTAPIPEGTNLKGLGERIFAAVLCLTSNLDSVVLQMPRCARAPPNVDKIRCAITSRIIDSALQDKIVGSTVLQNLTTVKVQPNMESFLYDGWDEHDDSEGLAYDGGDGDIDGSGDGTGDEEYDDSNSESCRGVRLDACPGLFNAPSITTVEGFKDSGGWDALPPRTRDVRVRGLLEPATLGTVCDYPALERLTVRPAAMDMTRADPDRDEFNTALVKRAPTLKYLCLQTMGNETLTPSYGRQRRLHCLPRMTRLETLSVELLTLFGWSDMVAALPLQDLLPRTSLRMLTLVEQWTFGDPVLGLASSVPTPTTSSSSPVSSPVPPSLSFAKGGDIAKLQGRYRTELYAMLVAFARSCASGRMPMLRRFDYVLNPCLAEVPQGSKTPGSVSGHGGADFERLREMFSEAGIRMELDVLDL